MAGRPPVAGGLLLPGGQDARSGESDTQTDDKTSPASPHGLEGPQCPETDDGAGGQRGQGPDQEGGRKAGPRSQPELPAGGASEPLHRPHGGHEEERRRHVGQMSAGEHQGEGGAHGEKTRQSAYPRAVEPGREFVRCYRQGSAEERRDQPRHAEQQAGQEHQGMTGWIHAAHVASTVSSIDVAPHREELPTVRYRNRQAPRGEDLRLEKGGDRVVQMGNSLKQRPRDHRGEERGGERRHQVEGLPAALEYESLDGPPGRRPGPRQSQPQEPAGESEQPGDRSCHQSGVENPRAQRDHPQNQRTGKARPGQSGGRRLPDRGPHSTPAT